VDGVSSSDVQLELTIETKPITLRGVKLVQHFAIELDDGHTACVQLAVPTRLKPYLSFTLVYQGFQNGQLGGLLITSLGMSSLIPHWTHTPPPHIIIDGQGDCLFPVGDSMKCTRLIIFCNLLCFLIGSGCGPYDVNIIDQPEEISEARQIDRCSRIQECHRWRQEDFYNCLTHYSESISVLVTCSNRANSNWRACLKDYCDISSNFISSEDSISETYQDLMDKYCP